MSRSRAETLLASAIGLQLLELVADSAATPSGDELDALLAQLRFHYSRHLPDYDDYVAELKGRADELEPVARWLAASAPRWWSDLDRQEQIWAGRAPVAPAPDRLSVELRRMHDEAARPRHALWTSTRTSASLSPWLDDPERPDVVHLWRLRVSLGARVAEIHSPQDWSALAHRYPDGLSGFVFTGLKHRPPTAQRLDPDWTKVAEDWDGIHLSVGGWLTAEDVMYEANGGRTELRGWGMESTLWLRWSFDSAEAIG